MFRKIIISASLLLAGCFAASAQVLEQVTGQASVAGQITQAPDSIAKPAGP